MSKEFLDALGNPVLTDPVEQATYLRQTMPSFNKVSRDLQEATLWHEVYEARHLADGFDGYEIRPEPSFDELEAALDQTANIEFRLNLTLVNHIS